MCSSDLWGLLIFVFCAGATGAAEEAPFHIGIMTGTVSQNEDDLRGAELLIQKYGSTSEGGMITHITYPETSCPRWRRPSASWWGSRTIQN